MANRPNLGALSGVADPTPISGMPEPDADDMAQQPSGGAMLDDETVKYHPDARSCGNCSHNQGGNCEILGHDIDDAGGCMVWESGAGDMGTGEMPAGGGPPAGMPMQGGT